MLNSFYKKFSLNNLQNDKPNGQIATILILIIVVILILILTTVNLGQLSISTTNLSNVADSSALYLASQLATRSYGLYKALGNSTSKCQSGGWASVFFAIIFAIAVTVITWGYGAPAGYVAVAAAVAGAVGGAAGAAYAGTSVLQGIIQGLIIGAAIGGGVVLGAGGGAGAGEAAGTAASNSVFAVGGSLKAAIAAYDAAYMIAAAPSLIGAIAGGTLAASSATYNAYVADQDQTAAIAAASRSLNGLPDYDLYREGIFLQVFSQTVDDPNKDMDTSDLDGDGKIDEKISHFLYYWDDRIKYLKEVIPTLKSITDNFVNGTLEDFKDYIQNEIKGTVDESYDSEGMSTTSYTPGILSKIGSGEDIAQNGSIAEVAEGLNLGFWDPQTEGSLDSIISGFNNFISEAEVIQAIDLDRLTANWQVYIKNFYNEDAGTIVDGSTVTDYYHTLEEVKGYLSGWKTQIKDARNQLPSCKTGASYSGSDEGGEYYCQPCYYSTYCANDCIISSGPEMSSVPCKLDSTLEGGSLDYNIDDEINLALYDIDTLISKISDFQDAIKQYAQDMENAYAAIENGYGGLNPATYSWTDSRGEHSIKAEVGNYQLASTITTSSGSWLKKTVCIKMVDYSDDGTNSWVEITRQDPKSKDVKSGKVSLGMWNPFFSGTITKKGKASYSYDNVGLAQ